LKSPTATKPRLGLRRQHGARAAGISPPDRVVALLALFDKKLVVRHLTPFLTKAGWATVRSNLIKRVAALEEISESRRPWTPKRYLQTLDDAARRIAGCQFLPEGAPRSRPSALNGAPYPSLLLLKGNVEVRTNGFIIRTDEADYDETTGEIEARGNVKVTPYPPLDKN
jgi:hypothetical protein